MREMYKRKYFIILILLFITPLMASFECRNAESRAPDKDKQTGSTVKSDTSKIPSGLKRLLSAYPDFLERADENHLYWKDGTSMIYDDGVQKTFEEKLDNADLEDMMFQEYTPGPDWDEPPAENFEPGRMRCDAFFSKMYGTTKSEVHANLVTITWSPSGDKVQVSSVNGVDSKMKEVAKELLSLEEKYLKYVKKTAGTFNYRKIASTNRMSTHSYGISIDINTAYSDYWQWDKSMTYKNRIPMAVVEVFERHGFIWGGKWYHYDTMHFEYRPELLN